MLNVWQCQYVSVYLQSDKEVKIRARNIKIKFEGNAFREVNSVIEIKWEIIAFERSR